MSDLNDCISEFAMLEEAFNYVVLDNDGKLNLSMSSGMGGPMITCSAEIERYGEYYIYFDDILGDVFDHMMLTNDIGGSGTWNPSYEIDKDKIKVSFGLESSEVYDGDYEVDLEDKDYELIKETFESEYFIAFEKYEKKLENKMLEEFRDELQDIVDSLAEDFLGYGGMSNGEVFLEGLLEIYDGKCFINFGNVEVKGELDVKELTDRFKD